MEYHTGDVGGSYGLLDLDGGRRGLIGDLDLAALVATYHAPGPADPSALDPEGP